MSAINSLVRKFKKAVTGVEEPLPRDGKPFNWEPAPVTPPALAEDAPPAAWASEAAATPVSWKRQAELPSVVGASIPADVEEFAIVYKGAGVQPPSHGYGVDRIGGMLQHKSLAGLDKSVKASAVLAALDAAGVPLRDVTHDGLLRYKALVAFEAAKELELHMLRPRNEHRIADLKTASEAFQQKKNAEIEGLMRETASAVASLARLKSRQRAEEERFHRTLALFVEPLPARIIPMPAKPPEAPPPGLGPLDSKPELKLVAPEPKGLEVKAPQATHPDATLMLTPTATALQAPFS